MKKPLAPQPPTLRATDPDYTRERFDVRQAAEYLRVGTDQIYRDAARQQIGYRRSGGRGELRFSQADLDAWREARRVDVKGTSKQTKRTGAAVLLELPRKRFFA